MARNDLTLFLIMLTRAIPIHCGHQYVAIARSIVIANGRIADELAKAGHDVLLFEPDFSNILNLVNGTVKVARQWSMRGFGNDLGHLISSWSDNVLDKEDIFAFNFKLYYWSQIADKMCKKIIENEEVMNTLRAESFDAVFTDQITFCGHGVAQALGIKVKFLISSCPVFETLSYILGYNFPFSYVPVHGMELYPGKSYWDRYKNVFYGMVSNLVNFQVLKGTTNIFREKYGPNFPEISEIVANSDIVFVNTDEFLDIPRPVMPNMINIGGMGATDYDKMPLGEMFPRYHFIARAEKEDYHSRRIAEEIPNLSIHHWIPQPAVLKHPRLKIFITHGGYNGLLEAARSGVPVVVIPIMLDQPKNSLAVEINGWGISVPKIALKNKPLFLANAIKEIISRHRYKENALRISRLIKEKPNNGTERLLKTTEFVIANGGIKQLLMEGRHHSLVQYYNLDIIVPTFLLLLIIVCLMIAGAYRVIITVLPIFYMQNRKLKLA